MDILSKKLCGLSVDDIWHNDVSIRLSAGVIGVDEEMFYRYLHTNGHLEHLDFSSKGWSAFRKATSLKREGFKFFRMTDSFWWDFYRICTLAKFPIENKSNSHVLESIIKKSSRKYVTGAKSWFFSNGMGKLIPSALKQITVDEHRFKGNGFTHILVVGTMSSGKSTLINALVGDKVANVKATVCTSSITYFCNRPQKDFVLYADEKVCIASEKVDKIFADSPMIGLRFDGGLQNKPIIFIDTPGINYAYDQHHRELTENEISSGNYDAIICVVNSGYMESDESKALVETVAKVKGKKKIFVLNQFDRFDADDDSIEESIKHFKSVLKELRVKADVIPLSAKAALLLKKRDKGEIISKIENAELLEYKRKMTLPYYDLGAYFNGTPSNKNDYYARTGLTYLETIIVQQ